MDLLLILIWFVIALGICCALIASAYYVYVRGANPLEIFAKLVLALLVYVLFTDRIVFLAGLILLPAHMQIRPDRFFTPSGS